METDYLLETNMVAARIMGEEKADIDQIIKDLIDTSWGGDNESQAKAVELLKGLAFSDDPKSNKFMQALDKFTDGLDAETFTESENLSFINEASGKAKKDIVNAFNAASNLEKHGLDADELFQMLQDGKEGGMNPSKAEKMVKDDLDKTYSKGGDKTPAKAYKLAKAYAQGFKYSADEIDNFTESVEEDYFVEAAMPKAEKDAMDISFEQLGVNVSAQFNKMYSDEFKKVLKDTMISGIKIMGDRKQLRTTMRQRAMKGLIKIKKQLNKTLKEI